MQLLCLGPLEVRVNGHAADLGEPQQRLVLAVLLSQAGAVVSTDRLVDDIWGDDPPLSARKIVQGYVSGLRRALGPSDVIESRAPGYRLTAKRGDIDSALFADIVAEAADKMASDPERARGILRQGLAMWRGAPYEDLADCDGLRPEIVRLESLHSSALQLRIEADIHADDALLAVAELADLTRRQPLEERLWALRMLALYRSGRQADALRAFDEARRALAEQVGLEPSAELRLLQRRILDQDPVLDTAWALASEPVPAATAGPNPYKGLRAFEESDAADFHGRDDLVRRLHEAVERRVGPRLVVVAGPSGCGKSSVVRAGLFPLLRAKGWRLGSMYPGANAIEALEATLAEVGGARPALILVDQLEEVQTGAAAEADRSRFLDRVSELAERDGGLWIVATVRTDFLDGFLAHRRFARFVEAGLVLVTPLDEHEVRAVVTRPASRVGVRVDPELIVAVVADVADRPAALPLLEFALTDLYDRSDGRSLSLDAYRAAGGISGSLAKRAEDLYAGLGGAAHETARRLFLQLTGLSEDGEPVRQRRPTAALAGIDGREEILSLFGRHRLLTFDRDVAGKPTVEVAHETLLTQWPRLRGWIDAARDSIRMQRQLSDASAEWEASGRDPSFLLRGARLARFDQPLTDVALGSDEQEFLQRSRIAHRRTRRRRSVAAWGSIAVFAALSGFALLQWQAAQREARDANARRVAVESTSALADDLELGVLLALEAVDISRRAGQQPLPEAVSALHGALQASRIDARLDGGALHVAFGPDGSLLATDMPNATEGLPTSEVVIWDAATRETLLSLVADVPVVSIDNRGGGGAEGRAFAFSPDGRLLAVAYQTAPELKAPIIVWDPITGEQLARLATSGWVAWNPTWSRDGTLLTAASWDGGDTDVVTTWEVASGREVSTFRPGPVGSLVAYRGGTIAVAQLRAERVGIYDLLTGEEVDALETPGLVPNHMAVDLVAGWMVLDGGDRLQAWDMGSRTVQWSGPSIAPRDIAVSPDGTTVALGGDGGLIRMVAVGDGTVMLEFPASAGVGGVAFDPSSDLFATVDVTGTRLWDVSRGGPPTLGAIEDSGGPWEIGFSPDGAEIAVSTAAGTFQRRAADDGELLSMWDGLMTDPGAYPVVSQDWGTVALVTAEGIAQVRDLVSGEMIRELPACTNPRALSPDGSTVLVDGLWLCGNDPPPGVDVRARVMDVGSGAELADLGTANVFRAAFNPGGALEAGRYVAANWNGQDEEGGFKDLLYVVDVSNGRTVFTLDIAPTMIGFDPTGRYVVSGTFEGGVVVVDLAAVVAGTPVAEAIVMEASVAGGLVSGIAMSAGGTLATAARGSTSVRLWDVHTGELIVDLPADATEASPPKLAFSPHGRYLLYTDAGNLLRKFLLDIDELVDLARSQVTRPLSADECRRYLFRDRCP